MRKFLVMLLVVGLVLSTGCWGDEVPPDGEDGIPPEPVTLESLASRMGFVEGSVSGLGSSISNLSNRMNSLEGALSSAGGLTSSERVELNQLKSDLDSAEATINTQSSQISDLKDRIEDLEEEEEQGGDVDPEDAVTVDLGYSTHMAYPGGEISAEKAIYFSVENNLEEDIEDIELLLTIHSRGEPIDFDGCVVTGGWPLQWEILHLGNGLVVLKGFSPSWGDGLEIEAKDDKDIYLTVGLTSDPAPAKDVGLYVEAKVEDYKVVS